MSAAPLLQTMQRAAGQFRVPSPGRMAIYATLWVAAAFFLLPLWIMLATSLKTMPEVYSGHIFAWPKTPSLSAWGQAWSGACAGLDCNGVRAGFMNSVKIVVPGVVLSVLLGSLNGYALSYWNPPGARVLVLIMLCGAFLPAQVLTYPLVRLFSVLHIYGTLTCIIIVHILFSLPITTVLFRNYYDGIPVQIVRAAQIDGAGYWQIYRNIILPLSGPAMLIVAILQVNGIWNDFYFGLVFAGHDNAPMTVQLNNLVGTTTGQRNYSVEMAATLLTNLVPFLVCALSGKWFARALTSGAVKG